MLLIYQHESVFDARTDPRQEEFRSAWKAYHQALLDAGVFVAGNRLERAATATTVCVKDGKRRVQDGPFAETKEHLGGFIILDLPSRDEALEWAARSPTAAHWGGTVEIRPVYEADAPA
jgi:hypothetical protein